MPDPAAMPPPPDPEAWADAWAVVGYLGAAGAALGGLARAWAPVIRLARHLLGITALEARTRATERALADIQTDIRELTHADPRPSLDALARAVEAVRDDLRDLPRPRR